MILDIADLVRKAHALASAKGWWDTLPEAQAISLFSTWTRDITIAAKLALIHSEVSEALECVRDGDLDLHFDGKGKPEGLPSELADVVIRVADLCGALDIDLKHAIEKKLAYNATREHRHGGRLL